MFTVADDGDGIAAEHLPHVFERFYRADSARDRGRGSSGIGLAIVKALTEAHGGHISAASRPGQGTTFIVAVPILGRQRRAITVSASAPRPIGNRRARPRRAPSSAAGQRSWSR